MQTLDLTTRFESTARAREQFLEADTRQGVDGVRDLVLASWKRSNSSQVRPDLDGAPVPLTDGNLRDARREHVLGNIIPIVRRLLVEEGSGMIAAVGDAAGTALWVDGDTDVLRRAERIHLLAGSSWNEHDIGTNGIGTAIATGAPVQVFGSEHFASGLHQWSCTGSPVRNPRTGEVVGFLDISGGPAVATPQAALLMRSVVAAVEAELGLHSVPPDVPTVQLEDVRLSVLGREHAVLDIGGDPRLLSLRHAELLLLMTAHPNGISAGELACLMYEADTADVTVRAEMSRLRKAYPGLVSATGPYQLSRTVHVDVNDVSAALRAGELERALDLYQGPVLPRSVAPGVVDLRHHTAGWLRNALLRGAPAELLLKYAYTSDANLDVDIWRTCHARLSRDSPHLPEVSAMLATLDHSIGVGG